MNILIFCSLAYPDVEFYNELYDYFSGKGARIYFVIFDTYNTDLRKLKIPREFCVQLGSSSLNKVGLPSFLLDSKKLPDNYLRNIIEQEIDIYQSERINIGKYRKKANAVYNFTENILAIISPVLVFRFHSSFPAHAIIKYTLRKNRVKYIDFERWAFPGAYVCSEYGYWSSQWQDNKNNLEHIDEYKSLVKNYFLSAETIYRNIKEESIFFERPYILFLTGDGISTGTALKKSEEYESVGCGWDNDKACVGKIESLLSSIWPECNLIIRQHPYTRPRLSESELSGKIQLAGHARLENLLLNAEAVICSHTGLIYHALKSEKIVAVLGHHELENTGILTCCHNVQELADWLQMVKYDKDSISYQLSEVIDIIAKYITNSVILLDHRETFQILDKYIRGCDNKNEPIPVAWGRIRIIILLLKPYFYLQRAVNYFGKLLRATFTP
jgi:hypothetical protein